MVSLKIEKDKCILYINGARVETYTREEGVIVQNVLKKLNDNDVIGLSVTNGGDSMKTKI